ncbi:hypothetical protein GCM10010358_44330 [Streptomyces minutiscleroticus]|uniref:Uncharacterized protein n=1 Tax=Streptomyces minutiscleroticus TaxID=68238 RepID=A0A918NPL9_9ACTN|nr:hypothetical protein [Streptomyces minutiscleroticus]GGX85348.1 hypothetical protein GCM10010358_44330 [Streptomyces minutiscleroticus]
MSAHHAIPALVAAAAATLVLTARWAVGRRRRRSPDVPTAPWDRTVPPAPGGPPPPPPPAEPPAPAAPDDHEPPVVRDAEAYVHRCWQQLRAHSDPPE